MKKLADIELSDDDLQRLVEMRGGCSCHISPPCSNHCEPMDEEEAIALGLLDDDELTDVPY